jgi:hypothetical protein
VQCSGRLRLRDDERDAEQCEGYLCGVSEAVSRKRGPRPLAGPRRPRDPRVLSELRRVRATGSHRSPVARASPNRNGQRPPRERSALCQGILRPVPRGRRLFRVCIEIRPAVRRPVVVRGSLDGHVVIA